MKKHWLYASTALLTLGVLSGCGKTTERIETVAVGTEEVQTTQEETEAETTAAEAEVAAKTFPSEYTVDGEKVSFHANVVAGENGTVENLAVYRAKTEKTDYDRIYSAFMADKELKDTQELEVKKEDGSDGISYYHHTVDGGGLSVSELNFRYYTAFSFQVLNSFALEKGESGYNADLYARDKNFTFASCLDARNMVTDQLASVGISLEDGSYQSDCYSLDYQTLQQEESIISMDGSQDTEQYKEGWSEDDDCYYLCFRQMRDGLPISYEYAGVFTEYNDANAPIQAIVSKNGIEMLSMDRLFTDFEATQTSTLLGFEEIAGTVTEKFADLLTNSTYDVEQAELVYLCLKKDGGVYEMKPTWVLDIKESVENAGGEYSLQMMVDAQTGEEVVL